MKNNDGRKFTARELHHILKDKGTDLNLQSVYQSLYSLEKDILIKKEVLEYHRIEPDKRKFKVKRWWYSVEKSPLKEDLNLLKKIKRFSRESGNPPRHSPKDKEEFVFKLKREAENWKFRYEQYLKNDATIREDFKTGINQWLKSAKKFNELSSLKEDILIILKN